MVRATEILKESTTSGFFIVMKPRRSLDDADFTLVAADRHKISFAFGKVVGFDTATNVILQTETTKTTFTEVSTSAVALGEFFYDDDTTELFIGITAGDLASLLLIATYEIYVSTEGKHFNRIPTDDTSLLTYFEPLIVVEPNLTNSVEDNFFGFVPITSANIALNNGTHFWERHLSESSFHRIDVDIYHFAGPIQTDNFKKVISGIGKLTVHADDQIEFQILDRLDLLDVQRITDTYETDDFSELDERFTGKPIREVFGIVHGFVPVNVDFKEDTPATTDNRLHAVIKKPADTADLADVTATVIAGSTVTVTKVSDSEGINEEDAIFLDRVAGVDVFVLVESVDHGLGEITHVAIASPMAAGDSVKKGFVSQIQIVQEDKRFFPLFNRDYTIVADVGGAGKASGFLFSTSLESNLGMPSNLSPTDQVLCKVYGTTELPTISGSPFGTLDSEKGVLVNPIPRIYQLLREIGIPETDVNTARFITVEATVAEKASITFPARALGGFPVVRDSILTYLRGSLIRLFIDEDGKWSVSVVGPLPAASIILEDNDMAPEGTFEYTFDYEDTYSKITVIGDQAEREYAPLPDQSLRQDKIKSAVSGLAEVFHSVKKTFEVETGLMDDADFDRIVRRYKFSLETRRGSLRIGAKTRIFDAEIDDVIEIQRTKMPGFVFDPKTVRSRSFAIREKRRNLKSVTIILDDQKGVEDNSGSW